MAERAKVTSVDALKEFRLGLGIFIDQCASALAEIDADMQRAASSLRYDGLPRWRKELQVRQDLVIAARTARSRKELMSMADMPSLVEERKNLDKAKRQVEEAEQKIEAVKKWARVIDREVMLYKGQSQRLSDAVTRDLPNAMLRLGRMIDALEKYAAIAGPTGEREGAGDANAARVVARALEAGDPQAGASAGATRGVAALRRHTPPLATRAAVPLESQPGFLAATGPALPEGGLLLKLGIAGERVDETARVVLALGVLGGGDYYIEHIEGDGTWYIGPAGGNSADDTARRLEALTAGALLALRPALREVLELPRGWLAVVVAGAVAQVASAPGSGGRGDAEGEVTDL